MKHKDRIAMRLSVGITWILLLFGVLGATPALAAEPNLLEELGIQARSYAAALAADHNANYSKAERITLRTTADMLNKRNHCDMALGIAKQLASGVANVPVGDWLRIGQAASCGKNWSDAVPAAWLGANATTNRSTRRDAFAMLGAALEGHEKYGTAYALAAYRESLAYGASKVALDKVHTMEQILAEAQHLRVISVEVQDAEGQPSLCFRFSTDMPDASEQKYADFIRFEPPFKAQFRKYWYAGNQICADGAAFGMSYQVLLLPGLVANSGIKLTETVQYPMETKERDPTVWFANSRYVLPLGGGVPIHGINVDRVALTLYKVVDRNLLQKDLRDMFLTDIGSWKEERIREDIGEQVWKGEADLTAVDDANAETITNLPMAEHLPQEPGIYILAAVPKKADGDEVSIDSKATMWLLVSDIGITSYQGSAGLTITTRSLATGKPLGGVKFTLYSRSNRLLGEAIADANGVGNIPSSALEGEGSREAVMLMATGPGTDFNFLDVSVAPYDLSDRGVAGRTAPGPVDAFLYTERGIYRPGETVHLAALLRTDLGKALTESVPVTMRLLRPDEQVAAEQVSTAQSTGGYSLTFPLSPGARTGNWKVQAFLDTEAEPIGTVAFQVEDIVPPRIEVNVTQTPTGPLKPADLAPFTVQAMYLFGAPGADLVASGELRIAADPNPFPTFVGYKFGPVDESEDSTLTPLQDTRTDEAGNAKFTVTIDKLPNIAQPLQAKLRVDVTDVDGRAVAASYAMPVRHKPLYIGIKAPGEAGRIREGAEAKFQVVVVDPLGQAISETGLNYQLVEEQTDYQWYQENGHWQFKSQIRDLPIRNGLLAVTAAGPALVSTPTTMGSYRLNVLDPATGAISSSRVQVGWGENGLDTETPDRLLVRTDRQDYRPGDVAKLTIQSPFTGPASLVLATNQVVAIQALDLTGPEQVVEVPVDANWGAGVYALLTAYRPDGKTAGHGPRRAVGLAWLGLAQELHRLPVTITAPETMRPRQNLEVKVQVSPSTPSTPVYVTVAAVDEGVLRLTDYKNPDPLEYYFGQRTLGVGLRDLYGRLIDGHQGTPGTVRSGGDESSRRGAPDPHVQIVSLFSGVVALDPTGMATIPFAIPDFNGKLRLVAVAWTGERVGETATPITVRDPVVLMPSVPRFLAAGDHSQASLLINNMEGAAGEYRLSWSVDGAIAVGNGPTEQVITLAAGERKALTIPLQPISVGNGTLHLRFTAPNGEVLERTAQIGVRAPFLSEPHNLVGRLNPGASVVIGPSLVEGLRPESVTGLLNISATSALNVPALLRQLDLYPYGCLEQVTSRAFPLLYIKRLAAIWGYKSPVSVTQRLVEAITLLLEKQQDGGGFGLWSSDDTVAPWLSAYAMDFLQQAKAAGVVVPDFMWDRGLEWLRNQTTTPETEDKQALAVQAYAIYLLAKNGAAPVETARYLLDELGDTLPSSLAAAQLGATFSKIGDSERATKAFALARKQARDAALQDYGSKIRDLAALIALFHEAGQEADMELVQSLSRSITDNQWLSTQEQAWLVLAANSLTDDPAPMAIKIQEIAMPIQPTPLTRQIPFATMTQGLTVANVGAAPVWYSLSVNGSPLQAPPQLEQGLNIRRRLLDLTGAPVDPEAISQGALLVMVLEGAATTDNINHQTLILDPLPAGLEIENAKLASTATTADLKWVGELSDTKYQEALDDRFVAALDIDSTASTRNFKLAYLVRAVTPGRYVAPPPLIEDMYKPYYRGRGDSGWLQVLPAK